MQRLIEAKGFPAIFLFLLNVVFFAPFFFAGKVPVDPNPLYQIYPWKVLGQSAIHDTNQARTFHHMDSTLQIYPLKQEARRQILEGKFPLWTDLVFCGAPLLANHVGVFHLLSPLYYLLPDFIGYGLTIVLQFFFAGWFLFLLCSSLGCTRLSSLVAAVAFMWNGYFLHWFGIVSIVGTLCWTPLILFFVQRLAVRGDWKSFHGLTFSLAAQFFGSHSQSWLFNLVLLAAFAAFHLFRGPSSGRTRFALRTAAALVLSAMIAAPQILPFFVAWRNSPRSGEQEFGMYEGRNHLSARKLITLAIPDFFGRTEDNLFSRLLLKPADEGTGSIWNRLLFGEQGSLYHRAWGYIGLIPLLLAILAFTALRRNSLVRFWAAVGLVSLFSLVLLGFAPLHQLIAWLWPGFDSLDHTRNIYLLVVSFSILSAFGLDHLMKEKPSWFFRATRWTVLFLLFLLLAGFFVTRFSHAIVSAGNNYYGRGPASVRQGEQAGPQTRISPSFLQEGVQRIPLMITESIHIIATPLLILGLFYSLLLGLQRNRIDAISFCILILLLTVADVYEHGQNDPPIFFASRDALYPPDVASLKTLSGSAQEYRVLEIQQKKKDLELPLDHYDDLGRYRRRGNRFFDFSAFDFVARPDALMPYRIPSAGGYLSLYPAAMKTLWKGRANDTLQFVRPGESVDRWAGGWIDLQSIRYLLASPGATSNVYPRIYGGSDLTIFENKNALPRAFVVDSVQAVSDVKAVVERVRQPGFDPRRLVYLDQSVSMPNGDAQLEWKTRIVRSTPDEILVDAETNKDAVLVLSDSYFPGWNAFVNNVPAKIYRADGCFRAVVIGAGTHQVRFVYRPREFSIGLMVCSLSLSIWAIVLFTTRLGEPQRAQRT